MTLPGGIERGLAARLFTTPSAFEPGMRVEHRLDHYGTKLTSRLGGRLTAPS
jgi:hypothetical protein